MKPSANLGADYWDSAEAAMVSVACDQLAPEGDIRRSRRVATASAQDVIQIVTGATELAKTLAPASLSSSTLVIHSKRHPHPNTRANAHNPPAPVINLPDTPPHSDPIIVAIRA
jgi:hypothetical protein